MSKVMVIEDDEILNGGLCYNLQKREITPVPAYTLEEAEKLLSEGAFDLVLLDVNLPDGDGFRFAKDQIIPCGIPFIFLTSRDLDEEIIGGYRLGADDYITKPFRIQIVMEKIQAVLRRCAGRTESVRYVCGNLSVDFEKRLVRKNGDIVPLTPTEYDLLQFLIQNRRHILTKEVLLEHIWDSKGNYVNEHTLSLNISRLRNKISNGESDYIKTVYGMGYRWVEAEGESI
ncbi:MAG: response regulator transcription factor [Dorea sp.]|jgi:DNA-binding response OmpR family regulator|nr:response regulator transcription factor [Dorea sp.]